MAIAYFDDDDHPLADPKIRRQYEAALGAFIITFNETDFRVSRLISMELCQRGLTALEKNWVAARFPQRLDMIALLASSSENSGMGILPLDELRGLNSERNILAHGHFDQNPFDGKYALVEGAKARAYSVERLRGFTTKLASINDQLRDVEAYYWLDDLGPEGSPHHEEP